MDAHPNMIIAHEYMLLHKYLLINRNILFNELYNNSVRAAHSGWRNDVTSKIKGYSLGVPDT